MEAGQGLTEDSIRRNADTVSRYLKGRLSGSPAQLYRAAGHLIVNGGKRLRPFMVIKSAQVLGGTARSAMPAAAAVEMIHNFTLVHDDIMDNDEMRHGVMTVHNKFGTPMAILAGDVLFSKAYQTISESGMDDARKAALVSRLAGACVDVCEGQLLDIMMASSKKLPGQSRYIGMIEKKTAALFDVSCAMGAICAGAGRSDIARLSSFGRNLGISFQITDDLIGITGESRITKKPVGNDLREGKKSLPILLAIKSARGADRTTILRSFGNRRASKSDLERSVSVIRSLGIEEMVRDRAYFYAKKARTSLGGYSGGAKDELVSLLDFVVKRRL